jgi:hypothetical protein
MLTGGEWSQSSSYSDRSIGMRHCSPSMDLSFSFKEEMKTLFVILLIGLFLPIIVAFIAIVLLIDYAASVYKRAKGCKCKDQR